MNFDIGDKVIYKNNNYILALFLEDDMCLIVLQNDNTKELKVSSKDLKLDIRDKVVKRLRTNDALEEDLRLANEKISKLEEDLILSNENRSELNKELILTRAAVADSLSHMEDSEQPFYNGIKTLKGILK